MNIGSSSMFSQSCTEKLSVPKAILALFWAEIRENL